MKLTFINHFFSRSWGNHHPREQRLGAKRHKYFSFQSILRIEVPLSVQAHPFFAFHLWTRIAVLRSLRKIQTYFRIQSLHDLASKSIIFLLFRIQYAVIIPLKLYESEGLSEQSLGGKSWGATLLLSLVGMVAWQVEHTRRSPTDHRGSGDSQQNSCSNS